jgi:putative transposase
MIANPPDYHRYRFPRDVITHASWLCHRFCLSFRDVEDLLAQRGIAVSYETIRQWRRKFGAKYARTLRHRQGRLGDVWHLDEPFVTIHGGKQNLSRAVAQDGVMICILLQKRRNQYAAERFFRKLLKDQGRVPWQLITDKLRSRGAAHRTVMPSVIHNTGLYASNRAEVPHQATHSANDQCEDSHPPVKHNDSCRSTGLSRIPSGWDATGCGQPPIGSRETAPSWFGKR